MNRGQLTLVARLHAAQTSQSENSLAFSAMHEALAEAHERIVQLALERDSERFMRLEAEAKVQAGRQARDAAMRALRQAMQALRTEAGERERKTGELGALLETERRARECAETRARAEQHAREKAAREARDVRIAVEGHARAFGRLEARCRTMAMQLKAFLAQAEEVAHRQSQELAQLKAELENERVAREEAARALNVGHALRVWKKLRLADR
ncbi:MAG: hypothetical protein ACXWC1_18635 [Burkholderiales bacterium]